MSVETLEDTGGPVRDPHHLAVPRNFVVADDLRPRHVTATPHPQLLRHPVVAEQGDLPSGLEDLGWSREELRLATVMSSAPKKEARLAPGVESAR
jgi:hypothetical protein